MPYLLIRNDKHEGSSVETIPTMEALKRELRRLSASTIFDADDYEVYKFTEELDVSTILRKK